MFCVTIRTGVVRVAGSMKSPMYETTPWNISRKRGVARVDLVADVHRRADPCRRRGPAPRPSTVLLMTNAAVVPAWMNWPGSTIFCTIVAGDRRPHRQLGPDRRRSAARPRRCRSA